MNTYTHLLIDLDGTIADTRKAIDPATIDAMKLFEPKATEEELLFWFERFFEISSRYWDICDNGKVFDTAMQREMLQEFFADIDKDWDANIMIDALDKNLTLYMEPYPEVQEVIKTCAKTKTIYVITNGFISGFDDRLVKLGIDYYITKSFVAEAIGWAKPSKGFFDAIFASGEIKKERCLIVGDQIPSDIMGGIQNGIDTCWVYRDQDPTRDPGATYKIGDLRGLLDIIA